MRLPEGQLEFGHQLLHCQVCERKSGREGPVWTRVKRLQSKPWPWFYFVDLPYADFVCRKLRKRNPGLHLSKMGATKACATKAGAAREDPIPWGLQAALLPALGTGAFETWDDASTGSRVVTWQLRKQGAVNGWFKGILQKYPKVAKAASEVNYVLVILSIFLPIQIEDLCINRAEVWPSCSLSSTRDIFFCRWRRVCFFLRLFFPCEIIYLYTYIHAQLC